MPDLGWSYPAGCTGTPYDDDPPCTTCGGWPDHPDEDSACSCPECPLCGNVGDPLCSLPVNDDGPGCGLDPHPYSIAAFLSHIGIAPLHQCLRAIDKYNLEHVWLVLEDGSICTYRGHHPQGWRGPVLDDIHGDLRDVVLVAGVIPPGRALDALPLTTRIRSVGAGCIAWDGSDWEYSSERPLTSWADVDAVRQDCIDAHEEYTFEFGEE